MQCESAVWSGCQVAQVIMDCVLQTMVFRSGRLLIVSSLFSTPQSQSVSTVLCYGCYYLVTLLVSTLVGQYHRRSDWQGMENN